MILVTGGTGFVGGHLLERLSLEGIPARCLVRPKGVVRRLPAGIETVNGDLVSAQGLDEALDGVDTVIHLAGVTAAIRKEDYWTGNVGATESLVRAMAGRRIRLVHVSSLAAIGPSSDGTPISEDAAAHPLTNYGRSKLEGEQVVRHSLPDAVVVRPAVVYGPRDTSVFEILRPISRGIAVEIWGGDRWFSAIYVADLVEALLAAARTRQAAGKSYFLAHPKPATWSELGQTAARLMGKRLRTIRIPVPVARLAGSAAEAWSRARGKPSIISREKVAEAECPYWTCSGARAAADLGFEARTSLADGLAETLAWYREAGWLHF